MDSVRIETEFGGLIFDYASLPELEQKLSSAEKIVELVRSKAGAVAATRHIREPKPGYADIYRFLPDGSVELLVPVTANVQRVGLVLFGHDRPLASALIDKWTGIPDAVNSVIQAGPNRRYFTRVGEGQYTLSPDGVKWITNTVVPKLRGK